MQYVYSIRYYAYCNNHSMTYSGKRLSRLSFRGGEGDYLPVLSAAYTPMYIIGHMEIKKVDDLLSQSP